MDLVETRKMEDFAGLCSADVLNACSCFASFVVVGKVPEVGELMV